MIDACELYKPKNRYKLLHRFNSFSIGARLSEFLAGINLGFRCSRKTHLCYRIHHVSEKLSAICRPLKPAVSYQKWYGGGGNCDFVATIGIGHIRLAGTFQYGISETGLIHGKLRRSEDRIESWCHRCPSQIACSRDSHHP